MRSVIIGLFVLSAGTAQAGCLSRKGAGFENGCNFTVGVRWRDEGGCRACSCTALVGGNDTQDLEVSGRAVFDEIKASGLTRDGQIIPARGDCR